MNNMRLLFSLLAILLINLSPCIAQNGEVILFNTKKIDKNRYQDIKGTPYLFKEWHPATIMSTEASITEVTAINYNAHTRNLEVKKGDQFIELDPAYYVQVIVHESAEKEVPFRRAFHTEVPQEFMQLVYDGEQVQVYKQIGKEISTKTFNDVGKKRTAKRFVTLTKYYLIDKEEVKVFKLNKKDILKKVAHKKAVEGFLKKNKLKLNKEEELLVFLKFYDSL